MNSPPVPRTSRAPRRALAAALLCGPLGAALTLVAAGQVWSESTTTFARGTLPVSVTGSDITGLPSALALVGLAALLAVFAVRRAARVVVAALLAGCGAGTGAAAFAGAGDRTALTEAAGQASGLAEGALGAVTVSAWPYVSIAGGALLLLTGLLALAYGRGWPSMAASSRYERGTRRAARGVSGPAPVDPDRPEDLWKALDRGEDPTQGTP